MFYPTNWLSSIRWLPAKNFGTQIIPPWGPCQAVSEADTDGTLHVAGGNSNNADCWFNGPTPIGVGQGGQVTRDLPMLAAIGALSRVPRINDRFGTVKGSPYLRPGGIGYTFVGGLMNGIGLFLPDFLPWATATDFFEDGTANNGGTSPGLLTVGTQTTILTMTISTPGDYFFSTSLSGRLDSQASGASAGGVGGTITGRCIATVPLLGALPFLIVQRTIAMVMHDDGGAPALPDVWAAIAVRGNGGTAGALSVPIGGSATLSVQATMAQITSMFGKIMGGSLLVVGPL
jgi:hypothetical protein